VTDSPEEPLAADQLAITGLLARYCVLLDILDVGGWVSLFTADATYEVDGRTYRGHADLRRLCKGTGRGLHMAGPPVIEADGPDRVRTTRNALFVNGRNGALRHTFYQDELVRTVDGWRIAGCVCRFVTGDGIVGWPDRGHESPVRGVDTLDWADV